MEGIGLYFSFVPISKKVALYFQPIVCRGASDLAQETNFPSPISQCKSRSLSEADVSALRRAFLRRLPGRNNQIM